MSPDEWMVRVQTALEERRRKQTMAADSNSNLIPDKWDRWLGVFLALAVGVLTLAIEGKWGGADVAVWCSRAVAVLAVVSSVFKIGVLERPGKGS